MNQYDRILVTGADGFLGSHLINTLHMIGYKNITALVQYNSFGKIGWLSELPLQTFNPNISIISGDIRDCYFLNQITKNIDVIFHLAALISVPHSTVTPQSYMETNALGTLNLCCAVKENKCKMLIHTSTSEVYGNPIKVPIKETQRMDANSPYAASKIAGDSAVLSLYRSWDLPIKIARPFNTYGPRQSLRAIIPTIITQILTGGDIILGNVHPVKDFTFVEDTVNGLITIANHGEYGEIYNIGSGIGVSISQLAKRISFFLHPDKTCHIAYNDTNRKRGKKWEVDKLIANINKIKKIGYCLYTGMDHGLYKTIEWFKKNLSKYENHLSYHQ